SFTCRSCGSRSRLRQSATIASEENVSVSGCRRMGGATLKKRNSIHSQKREKEYRLMQTENQLSEAIEAALDKKAQDAVVLELGEVCSFTDYFLICTGTSTRHNQTIADHIEETLKKQGVRPLHI